MIIMLLVFGLLPKQAQPCHGSGPQTIEGIMKQDEAQVENKQGKMLRVEEANKAERLSHLQEREKRVQSRTVRIIHLRRRKSSEIYGRTRNSTRIRKSVSIHSSREK